MCGLPCFEVAVWWCLLNLGCKTREPPGLLSLYSTYNGHEEHGYILCMDESDHGPHLPGQGAFYTPDRVVIPRLRDKGMDDAQMHTWNNVKQQSDKCYSTNHNNLNIQITDDSHDCGCDSLR